MAKQDQARMKEIDDVQEEIRKTIEKLDKTLLKKQTSEQKGG